MNDFDPDDNDDLDEAGTLAFDDDDVALEDDIDSDPADLDDTDQDDDGVRGRRITIVGRLGGMNRREASNLLRSYGAVVVESESAAVDWIVIGAEESPLAEAELIEEATRRRGQVGQLQILHETDLWHRLGLVDGEHSIRKLHTPAMLAHLLGVSVHVIRRWHRRGLIKPVRTLHRLPYFDFQEVATARRLAAWVASGASPEAIERRLLQLIEIVPDLRRPLDQLSILVEGKHVLLRQGEGLIEPGGQLRFDFDLLGQADASDDAADAESEPTVSIRFPDPRESNALVFPPADSDYDDGESEDDLLLSAYEAEDEGDLAFAVDCYHALLAREGVRADWHFQIGELLYRMGEVIAARERYYAAIEIDPDFVEARSSLAGVLAETGQLELAVAAYRGTLALHDDYPDVQYNLAKLLDQLDRPIEAEQHWRRFLQLAPGSPWADEARGRLESDGVPF
ncbi:MerR family transcriptional regulator [Aporhodopirellula aestuarii]|uniref:MerR family transcriptional regulator n=1 Tax=Aporhodopirellula aestuarii TaxID=2950107 RepID=A0ABT0U0P5_9BACT|nr:MerR family transcriptional regulator [Aporhodopirellula aestuarii]MCM2370447.1 MerR family transcriptional regulator [Aporhodopirellula aestuarii]